MWSSTITHSDLHMMEATDIELVHLIHMVISDLTDYIQLNANEILNPSLCVAPMVHV